MTFPFLAAVRSEWLKQRRSLASWLAFGGGVFIPGVITAIRLLRPAGLRDLYRAPGFWERLWTQTWESMAIMIVPLAVMLAASVIVQIEYRNNTWKQLHATPQPLATIFLAKLVMILKLAVQLFFWCNAGIYLAGVIPALVFRDVDYPSSPIPLRYLLGRNLDFFVDALPIVALQYLLALRFKSFMAPLGAGFALWILALGALPWEYNYLVPYSYLAIDYTLTVPSKVSHALPLPTQVFAVAYFVLFTLAAYVLYARRSDKG
jgi:lantibiotic transport system permease protein